MKSIVLSVAAPAARATAGIGFFAAVQLCTVCASPSAAVAGWGDVSASTASVARVASSSDLQWVSYKAPTFPAELAGAPINWGHATLLFSFDRSGQIVDRLVINASHPAFAAAVYAAVESWQMEPHASTLSTHRESVRFDFDRRKIVLLLNHREGGKVAIDPFIDQAAPPVSTCLEADLKSPLVAIEKPMPEFPALLAAPGESPQATVNFVVDESGRVRVPAVTSASGSQCAEVALAAVKKWRFQAPLRDSRPVQVVVDRTFHFGQDQLKDTAIASSK
jgi:TonB family protein